MTDPSRTIPSPELFLQALLAAGSALLQGSNADLYDSLLGDWEAEVIDHLPGGTSRRQRG